MKPFLRALHWQEHEFEFFYSYFINIVGSTLGIRKSINIDCRGMLLDNFLGIDVSRLKTKKMILGVNYLHPFGAFAIIYTKSYSVASFPSRLARRDPTAFPPKQ
jgi:hypothetical protein